MFSNIICSSTNNHEHFPYESTWVLISPSRLVFILLRRCLNPIPSAISVSTQPPRVIQSWLITWTPSKYHDHTVCTSLWAQWCTVIDSHTGLLLFLAIHTLPKKWTLLNLQEPAVIHRLLSCVSSKHYKIWLRVSYGVTIAATWCLSNYRDYCPYACVFRGT